MTLRPRALATVAAVATLLTSGVLLAPSAAAEPAAGAAPAPTSTKAAAGSYTPAAPLWGACGSERLQAAQAQCALLEVPLDYDEPGGTTIKLALSRVLHTTKRDQGIMLVNPGGPGGSELGLSTLGRAVPDGAGDSYDWIGFDPRGVGASEPAVSCDPTYLGYGRPRYVPTTPAVSDAWFTRSKAYTDACAQKTGPSSTT